MTTPLVSLDVGGTLGRVDGPTIADVLAAASPLDPVEARRIMRHRLHTRTSITESVVADVCTALRIPEDVFPRLARVSPLRLLPGAVNALRAMSQHAMLVTLSNVTCLEADTDQLHELLSPWVAGHFPSCCIGYAKPDADAFRSVARACGTSTTHMVHIGDDWECDIMGARSAGATAIWISKGRPVPGPAPSNDPDVLVAGDLSAAARHIKDLTARRRP